MQARESILVLKHRADVTQGWHHQKFKTGVSVVPQIELMFSKKTRMHSSRMRTVRCSGRLLGQGGVCPGRVSAWGGCLLGGGCLPDGCTPPFPLWTKFLTHACENITFLQLRLRTVKIFLFLFFSQIILMVADDMACNPRNPRPGLLPLTSRLGFIHTERK